jgi:hypothetical protein
MHFFHSGKDTQLFSRKLTSKMTNGLNQLLNLSGKFCQELATLPLFPAVALLFLQQCVHTVDIDYFFLRNIYFRVFL